MPFKFLAIALLLVLCPAVHSAAAGVPLDHPDIARWADVVIDYAPGAELDATWQDPETALGPASGEVSDITGLGRGGFIVLAFDAPLVRGQGWDFAVFENGFSETFLELAWVSVSSDGETFVRFPGFSFTPTPVPAFGAVDPDDVAGFAGRFPLGTGDPFDLDDIALAPEVVAGVVDLDAVTHIRLDDIVGDGSVMDSEGRPIFDPYPTTGSAGFDLQAVAARGADRTDDNGDGGNDDGNDNGDIVDTPTSNGSAGIGGGCTAFPAGNDGGLLLLALFAGAKAVHRMRMRRISRC